MAGIPKHVIPGHQQAVDKAGPREGKLSWFKIDGTPGLYLVVQPTGTATYFLRYVVRDNAGKRINRNIKLGTREAGSQHVTLARAKTKAAELMGKVAQGDDPVGERGAKESSAKAALTFRQIAELRLAQDTTIKDRTRHEYRACLTYDAFEDIGDVAAKDVTREMIAAILAKVEGRGASRHADHVKSAISSTYRWALDRNLVLVNPTVGFKKRHKYEPRARVLASEDISKLWSGLSRDDLGQSEAVRVVLKLALLTAQRRSEIISMRRADLSQLDGAKPTWTIPKERTKNGKEHRVHLSHQAAALICRALELSAKKGSEFVFPVDAKRVRFGTQPKSPHMHADSVTVAMTRLRASIGIEDATVHDLRRTVATWLGEQMVRPDVIAMVVNHSPKIQDITRRVYNQATMAGPVRQAMQSWADHVWEITGQASDQEPGKVVRLSKV